MCWIVCDVIVFVILLVIKYVESKEKAKTDLAIKKAEMKMKRLIK